MFSLVSFFTDKRQAEDSSWGGGVGRVCAGKNHRLLLGYNPAIYSKGRKVPWAGETSFSSLLGPENHDLRF